MEILIACNEHSIATKLRNCLAKLGVECAQSRVLSHESAQIAASQYQGPAPVLVFFGSQQLAADDLSALSRLCSAGGEHFKVVAVSVDFTAGGILQAVRNGAVDCLNVSGDCEHEVRHLLDRIQVASGDRTRLGRLLTVIAPVGGAGTSVLAINLAAMVAEREQRCGLLDLHWRGGDLATLLNSSPRHTLLSLAAKMDQLDRTMFEQSLVHHKCGIYLLASPEPFSDYRQIRAELIQKIVQLARATFSTVVVDLEDCEHFDQVRTLAASDQIIIPLRPDFVSVVRTKKLLHHLLSASVSREHIKLVINRMGHSKELPVSQIEEALGMPHCFQLPDDPVSINESINLGTPIVIARRQSKVKAGMLKLADSLLDVPTKTPPTDSMHSGWLNGRRLLLPFKSLTRLFGAMCT